MQKINQARQWLKDAKRIVFFGGAGTSTASGIPDFRGDDGAYSKEREDQLAPEYVLSHTYLLKDPEGFSRAYKKDFVFPDKMPNAAHEVLVSLEKQGKLQAVITQNIDGLHQKAGSENVLELHGNMVDHHCEGCGKHFDLDYALSFEGKTICDACGGFVRPDVVLYEEPLPNGVFEEAIRQVQQADVLIVAGTSLIVYPAAGLLSYYRGDKLILINQQSTPLDSRANLIFNADIGETLKQITEEINEN